MTPLVLTLYALRLATAAVIALAAGYGVWRLWE